MLQNTADKPISYRQRAELRNVQQRAGGIAPLVAGAVFVILLLLGTTWFLWFGTAIKSSSNEPLMTTVTRGEFIAQVIDQGEVQSSENVEIRCEVEARNGDVSVISLVPEGTLVREGEFLVQLSSTSFDKELEQQKIAMANAETAKIQAETSLASAQAALNEYINGTFVEKKKEIQNEIYDAESEIKTAQQELKQAQAVFEHSKKLHAKAFITRQTLEADEFAVQKAEIAVKKANNSLELAEQKLQVLEEITFKKEKVQLESDIKAAKVELSSQIDSYAVEQEKLTEIKTMIENCTVRVPPGVSGQVVYARQSSRRDEWVLEEGATVRQNQVLIRLPNPQKMEVKALVNEQSITQIEPNMPVSIKVDALNNTTLTGVVTKVNQYAESSGWISTRVRKYAVFVSIIDPPDSLKPGMNASVAIQTQYKPDVLLAPIQSVYSVQGKNFCLTRTKEEPWKTLTVDCGGENANHVYFTSGVSEGTQLVLNPRDHVEHMELPEEVAEAKIELPKNRLIEPANLDSASKQPVASDKSANDPPGSRSSQPGNGFLASMPENGAVLIQQKDTDGDGKLTKVEAGEPFTRMFDRIDTDGDGFVSQSEADASIRRIRKKIESSNRKLGGGQG